MKIAFIGAGSIVFASNLLTDILSFPKLRQDITLCLEDIDDHRLQLMKQYMEKYRADNLDELKNVQIEATTNQREAIKGARYIISAIQVGGVDAYALDVEIPQKYGVHQVVGDSLGPGGVFRFLRTAPVFKSILKDIDEVGEFGEKNGTGSRPLFLNYTNPMAMNTWYCNAISPDSTIGLCHGVQGTSRQLKMWIGAVGNDEFDFMAAGINHMAWFLKLWYKDPDCLKGPWKDAYPLIWEHFKDEPQMTIEEKVRIDMMKATGYYMTESSGHLSEYLPYYLKRKDLIAKYRSERNTGFETLEQGYYLKSCQDRANNNDEKFEHAFKSEKLAMKKNPSEEYGSRIINSMETGEPFRFNGNVINKKAGLITNLPADCCVEVPILVDYMGLHPQGGIELPPVCQGLCMSNIMVQQAAVKAALTGQKDLVYHAVLLDPNTASVCSPEEIRQMVDEMLTAEQKWLPSLK
jgi:alpha-galactosidase